MRSLLILVLVLGCLSPAWADGPADLMTPPADGPTRVMLGLFLIDVTNIDELRNTFDVELDVIASWRDSRLAYTPQDSADTHRVYVGAAVDEFRQGIWTSQAILVNAVGQPAFGVKMLTLLPDGTVHMKTRMNTTAKAQLDYRRFPFDRQELALKVEPFAWNSEVVELASAETFTGYVPGFDLPEWRVTRFASRASKVMSPRDSLPFSRLTFTLSLERKAGFFLWKIFLTVVIIVSLSWVVFWMSDERLGRRAGISTTGILTVIAYQFVTSSTLPRVSYLTVADRVMVVSILFIAFAMVESIVVDGLDKKTPGRKARVDRICRWAFPLAYASVIMLVALTSGLLG